MKIKNISLDIPIRLNSSYKLLQNITKYKKVSTIIVTPRPDEVHSTCNRRGAYVHQVSL